MKKKLWQLLDEYLLLRQESKPTEGNRERVLLVDAVRELEERGEALDVRVKALETEHWRNPQAESC